MEHVQGQEMDTTEQKVEVYLDKIDEYLRGYVEDHQLENKDLYTIDQSRWNSVLLYIYKNVFKPLKTDVKRYNENSNIDYTDKELLNTICDIYISLCYEYSKEVSIMGFSKLTGIDVDTIYNWAKSPDSERGSFVVAKKLNAEREESLSVRLVSGKGNPVGILGILNRHYNWNMGQPRGTDNRQAAPSIPEMEHKYLEEQRGSTENPQLPEVDF